MRLSYQERQRRFPLYYFGQQWARGLVDLENPGRAAAMAQLGHERLPGIWGGKDQARKAGSRRCRQQWYRVTASCGSYTRSRRARMRGPRTRVERCTYTLPGALARDWGTIPKGEPCWRLAMHVMRMRPEPGRCAALSKHGECVGMRLFLEANGDLVVTRPIERVTFTIGP